MHAAPGRVASDLGGQAELMKGLAPGLGLLPAAIAGNEPRQGGWLLDAVDSFGGRAASARRELPVATG
ncbi:MAG TPA: hypothetical protein VF384_15485 [Planctomycetota bacterium]